VKRLAAALAVTLAAGSLLAGQSAPAARAFDVISVRPNRSSDLQFHRPMVTPNRVEFLNTTVRSLLGMSSQRFAFDPRQIVGGPDWLDSDRFDIVATTDTPVQLGADGFPGELFAMIRALLEDRFRLKTHNEQRERNVYALVPSRADKKPGAGLRPVPDACKDAIKDLATGKAPPRTGPPPCSFGGPPGTFIGTGVTIAMFANALRSHVGRQVVDRSGFAGSFDIEMTFDPASSASTPPDAPPGPRTRDDTAPSIFTALQEQLGLKLESTRASVDVLVIDSAEPPTPN
jgi:uncharacterized protein (TIGR03435 family)